LKFIALAILLIFILNPGLASASPLSQSQEGGQAYTVQAADSLSGLAYRFYQDFDAWPAIQLATNAKAVEDSHFAVIKNPNVLEAGQLLWIPDPAEAERLLAGYAPVEPELHRI
jgi:nucleoid-associated protein YgaU